MGSIHTQISLVDAVSDTIYNIADSMNLLIAGFEAAQIAGDRAFDPSSVNEMRAAIEQVYGSTDAIKSALIPPTPPEPVKWKLANPNTQVFMNTGIDRYQQEIQSANALLQQLANTQESIATQADSTNIFYGDATADLTALNGRIVNIQQRILQMQSQPVTDIIDGTVNSQLERLRSQLSTAVQEQSELNNAVQNLDVSAANTAYQRLSATIGNTEQYIRDNIGEQEQFNETINAGSGSCDNLTKKIAGIAASYLSIQAIGNTIKNAVNLSDTITQTTARLDMMNDDLQTTQDLQNMIYLSAQRSRGSYQETADAVAKMGVMAGDAFKSNEELVAFSEQLNKQFAIAGTAPEGISAAMLQLTQAMGSGVLRGEELNSVFDQAPTIVQSIADYIGVDIGQIRELAQEGKITAETVKNAMLSSAEETNAAFENMPLTFGQIATQIQNDALMIFQPILDKLSEIANSEDFSKMMNSVINTLAFVSGIVATLFDLIVQVGSFAFDNWSILQPIILGIAIALTIYTAVLAIYNTQKAITAMREKIHAAATMMSTGATFAATAAQHGLNAALLACPITWILLIIIAVIAAIYAIVAAINKVTGSTLSATGIICGAIAVAGASIWNLIVGVVNAIIGIGVELWNLIAVFANFFANVFNDPVGAIIVTAK